MTLVSTYVANEDRGGVALPEAGDEALAGLEVQRHIVVLAEPLARDRGPEEAAAQDEEGPHLLAPLTNDCRISPSSSSTAVGRTVYRFRLKFSRIRN